MINIPIVSPVLRTFIFPTAYIGLGAPSLSEYDNATGQHFLKGTTPSPEHLAVVDKLRKFEKELDKIPRRKHIPAIRKVMDELFDDITHTASFIPVNAGSVPAEWVIAPGADANKRLLYIHGGGFVAGSPRSHRTITTKLSELIGGAVLAIDYRLMPEHKRSAGIEDCRTAYRWILERGPQGAAAPTHIWVAGDSAGGNLTLALLNWMQENGLRKPNGAIALSPVTDFTLQSPSLRNNVDSDPILGPVFGWLVKMPSMVLFWGSWVQARMNPLDTDISPIFANLRGLPPVLVHCSAVEMLRDDGRRYVNRAAEAGSPVLLQTWEHMVHVWHLFHNTLPEGQAAFEEIRKFIVKTSRSRNVKTSN